MTATERLVLAAAFDLAARLARPGIPPRRPVVAESTKKTSAKPPSPAPDFRALEGLARQAVETVLALAGQELNEKELASQVERAAKKYLMAHPELPQVSLARLAAETPRILNLPRLAELASQGLVIGPAWTGGLDLEPEMVVGPSRALAQVLKDLEKVAQTDLPVLLTGESGTGKEMLARRLHRLSPRRQGPLVTVNCAALVKTILESELFGHVKGAFSGASAPKGGYIQAAEGGTLFLDEIGETTPEFQVRLLRVLEDRMVVPVGSTQGRRVDFRLVAATHRDLSEGAAQGTFNQALLYRIKVVPLWLPPLRERPEDLPLLLDHFLGQACLLAKKTRQLAPETRQALLAYDWPGNVRELSHVLQRLVVLSEQYDIKPDLLPAEFRKAPAPQAELVKRYQENLDMLAEIPGPRRPVLARMLAEAKGGDLTNKSLRERLGCSDSTAKNILRALSQAGVLEPYGRRGGRRYRVGKPKEV